MCQKKCRYICSMESLKNFGMAFETSTDFCTYLSSFYSGQFESLFKMSHFVTPSSLSNTLLLASKCIQYCIVLSLPLQVKFLGCTCSVPPPAATIICVDAMHCCLLNRCIPLWQLLNMVTFGKITGHQYTYLFKNLTPFFSVCVMEPYHLGR